MKSPWLETLVIRRSLPDDSAFFHQILAEIPGTTAEGDRLSLEQTLHLPRKDDLSADFSRAGDLAVVATDGRNVRMGAAWARLSWSDAPKRELRTETPEVRLAVRSEFRGRGVGSALLLALLSALGREGVRTVSITADKHSGLVALYERVGFQTVDETADAFIMVASLEGLIDQNPGNSAPPR